MTENYKSLGAKDSNTLQAFWVALGSLTSFAFAIVSSMILSRYFTKGDYGTYKQVMYVYNTLLTVFTLGLPKAYGYFLPRVALDEGKSLINKVTAIFFILGGIFSGFLFLSAPLIADFLNNEDLGTAIKIFSPVPFLMLPTMGIESIYATYRKTYISSIYLVITRILMLFCVAVPVILFDGNYLTALWGFVIASLISFVIALYLINLPYKGTVNKKCEIKYKHIFKFSIPLLYASIWGTIITSSDQFFISRYFGNKVFADFSNGSMELPFVGMIIGACSTVLFPLFSKINNENINPKEIILPIWDRVFEKTAKLIYPLIVFCWVFAVEIIVLLYGEKYIESGYYFRIKLVANLFTLISYAPIILALGKTRLYANVMAYGALILILLEYLSIQLFNSPYLITGISVLCQIGRIFFLLTCIAKYLGTSVVKLFPLRTIGIIIIPSLLFLLIAKSLIETGNMILNISIVAVIYLIFYTVWSIIFKLNYNELLSPIISQIKRK